jgi:hypothetical protein
VVSEFGLNKIYTVFLGTSAEESRLMGAGTNLMLVRYLDRFRALYILLHIGSIDGRGIVG